MTFETSTTRASAHPDAQIVIDNSASSDNLKSVTLALPNGFWGSLAAASKCTGTAADPTNANFGNCPANTKVGSVTNVAEIDTSTARLRGEVFLADASAAGPTAAAQDPASIIVKVHPKLGAVVFKDIVLAARAQVRYGPTGAGSATDAVGPVQGITTTITNIPDQVDDDDGHYDPVSFKLDKVQIDLKSRIENIATTPALLSNPSSCASATSLGASFGSYSGATAASSVPYQATGCSTVKFAPTASFATVPTAPTAGSDIQLTSSIALPADTGAGNGSFNRIVAKLPPEIGAKFPALGNASDQCPSSSGSLASSSFSPTACPVRALIGTAAITTPMLPDPVIGDVYLINKSPLPWLGIDVSPTATNPAPKGVVIRLLGQTTTSTLLNPSCDDSFCQSQISATFANLPDAPVSSVQLNITPPDNRGGSTLSGKLFNVISSTDQVCQPTDEFSAVMTGTAVTAATSAAASVSTLNVSGCDNATGSITLTGGPYGTSTTSTTPTFTFTDPGGGDTCSIDKPTAFDSGDGTGPAMTSCSGTFTPSSPLSVGVHVFYVSNGTTRLERGFVVKSSSSADDSPPATSIDSGPSDGGSTPTTTPQFSFSSSEASSTFTCSVDDAAFLPCTSPFTTPAMTTGQSHAFEVRATDPAGNPDITAAKRTFSVDVPFAPTITVTPSTLVARAHPSLDVEVNNLSAENIQNLKLGMPDGFFGGLTGVAQTCTVAQAKAGINTQPECPSAAKVGTVQTHAAVLSDDGITQSDINIAGDVYLTDGFEGSQPAGLLISVHAKVSTVDLGYINVPVQLAVRDHALGIDTLAFNVPQSITSVDGTSHFELRDLSMHIETGAGAPQPLLTNPSQCQPQSFSASFTSYDSTTATASAPFNVTGCSSLPFGPQLGLTMKNDAGGAPGQSNNIKRVGVNLNANLTADPSGAGLSSAVLTLPHPVTIDVQHIPTPCTVEQQQASACPAASAVGSATASTPLLPSPLTGTVYVLVREPGSSDVLPRVLVALRGKINVDIIGTNSFVNGNQIVSKFKLLPDAPITSFNLSIGNSFLTTRPDACTWGPEDWNVTGVLSGYNGSQSSIVSPQTFDCANATTPTASFKLKKNKAKTTLTGKVTAQGSRKLKKVTLTLPKGLTFNKSAFKSKKTIAKYVSILGNGTSKLKTTCFKKKSSTKLEITFCKKATFETVTISLKKGSLTATKKLAKKPKFKVRVVGSDNKTKTAKIVKG